MLPRHPPWTFWLLGTLLVVTTLAWRGTRRLVIYHVDAAALGLALSAALGPEGLDLVPTLTGYQQRAGTCEVQVEFSKRWSTAVILARGNNADHLIRQLTPELRRGLAGCASPPTGVSLIFFGLSALTMLIPLAVHLVGQPHARAALRALMERLQGG